MRQGIVSILICGVLSGCAAPNNGSWWNGWGALASAGEEYQFDFEWELTGSDQLAPLQVFSNAQQLWLQFAADESLPALFALQKDGLVPLQAKRQGVYHVVNSRVDVLLLRRGTEQAWAYRSSFMPALLSYLRQQQASMHTSSPPWQENLNSSVSTGAAEPMASFAGGDGRHSSEVMAVEVEPVAASVRQIESSVVVVQQEPADKVMAHNMFGSHASDNNFKQLLQRWALAAGWVFNDEHWAVKVEVPLSGPFSYQGSFTDAVQQLLLSTQLGDYPLRPCFYSNQVLRVMPLTSTCVVAHEAVAAPVDSSQGIQTKYVEQEVFVPLPWVAGSAKNILAP